MYEHEMQSSILKIMEKGLKNSLLTERGFKRGKILGLSSNIFERNATYIYI